MKIFKTIIILTSLFFGNKRIFSQTKIITDTISNMELELDTFKAINAKDEILLLNKMPEFPGGVTALKKYISEHIKYSSEAKECEIEGTVIIKFEVTKTGEIGKVELLRGVDPKLDNEAIRVIKTLPKFIPGEQNGEKINLWYVVKVPFILE